MSESKFPLLEQCNPKNCIVSKTMKINRLMNQLFRKHLSEVGITLSQLSMMFLISKRSYIPQNEIGDILFLEKSTVSRNLNRLVQEKYIVKKKNKMIHVTVKGKKLIERVIPKWEQAMDEARDKITYRGEEALQLVLNKLSS